ncbi:1794_t:CDS:1, partial [Dentiscutata heterogama]
MPRPKPAPINEINNNKTQIISTPQSVPMMIDNQNTTDPWPNPLNNLVVSSTPE